MDNWLPRLFDWFIEEDRRAEKKKSDTVGCPLAENIFMVLLPVPVLIHEIIVLKNLVCAVEKNTFACAKMQRHLSQHPLWFTGFLHCKIF